MRRRKLQEERKSLIVNGKLTQQLRTVLCSVFSEYSGSDDSDTLEYTEAARLWYRCGFKLSSLHELLDKTSTSPTLSLEAFLQVIAQIAEDDEKVVLKIDNVQEVDVSCQVCVRAGWFYHVVTFNLLPYSRLATKLSWWKALKSTGMRREVLLRREIVEWWLTCKMLQTERGAL